MYGGNRRHSRAARRFIKAIHHFLVALPIGTLDGQLTNTNAWLILFPTTSRHFLALSPIHPVFFHKSSTYSIFTAAKKSRPARMRLILQSRRYKHSPSRTNFALYTIFIDPSSGEESSKRKPISIKIHIQGALYKIPRLFMNPAMYSKYD